MEIKIVISEGGSGAGQGEASSVHVTRAPGGAGAPADSEAAGVHQMAAPPEVLRAAAAMGAINAGPAPGLTGAPHVDGPPPFIGASVASEMGGHMGSATSPRGESAGAAPGSGHFMETTTAAEGGST